MSYFVIFGALFLAVVAGMIIGNSVADAFEINDDEF